MLWFGEAEGAALHHLKMSVCKEEYVTGSDIEEVVLPTVTEMDKLNNINEHAISEGELYVKLCYYPLKTKKLK